MNPKFIIFPFQGREALSNDKIGIRKPMSKIKPDMYPKGKRP